MKRDIAREPIMESAPKGCPSAVLDLEPELQGLDLKVAAPPSLYPAIEPGESNSDGPMHSESLESLASRLVAPRDFRTCQTPSVQPFPQRVVDAFDPPRGGVHQQQVTDVRKDSSVVDPDEGSHLSGRTRDSRGLVLQGARQR